MRPILILPGLFLAADISAQYDVGLSVGVHRSAYREGKASTGHEYANVQHVEQPALSLSAFYRERISSYVDIAFEIRFMRRSFGLHYGSGGLGGGFDRRVHTDLDLLHLALTPEVRMGPSGNAVVRFGLMGGVLVGGKMNGSWSGWSILGSNTGGEIRSARPSDFTGGLQVVAGFGFRTTGRTWALCIDPYAGFGILSLLNNAPGLRANDIGVTIGVCRRVERRPFSRWLGTLRSERDGQAPW